MSNPDNTSHNQPEDSARDQFVQRLQQQSRKELGWAALKFVGSLIVAFVNFNMVIATIAEPAFGRKTAICVVAAIGIVFIVSAVRNVTTFAQLRGDLRLALDLQRKDVIADTQVARLVQDFFWGNRQAAFARIVEMAARAEQQDDDV